LGSAAPAAPPAVVDDEQAESAAAVAVGCAVAVAAAAVVDEELTEGAGPAAVARVGASAVDDASAEGADPVAVGSGLGAICAVRGEQRKGSAIQAARKDASATVAAADPSGSRASCSSSTRPGASAATHAPTRTIRRSNTVRRLPWRPPPPRTRPARRASGSSATQPGAGTATYSQRTDHALDGLILLVVYPVFFLVFASIGMLVVDILTQPRNSVTKLLQRQCGAAGHASDRRRRDSDEP
jgi:hypothetical protein